MAVHVDDLLSGGKRKHLDNSFVQQDENVETQACGVH